MMMFSRLAFTALATLALTLPASAAPTPSENATEVVQLEARTTHVGRGTWFNVGLGNCGKWNVNRDSIVAISKSLYDQNHGSNCGQYVEITNVANGKKAYAMTRDSCPSCGYNDLDLSPAAFEKLASLNQGVIKISWHFMNKDWYP